jgi:hypothetical protein
MNSACFFLVVFFAGMLCAQQPVARQPSVAPLPPKPWLKKAPARRQWVISYDSSAAKAPKPVSTDPDAKKTVVVTKYDNLLSETTARQNGSVVRKWLLSDLTFTQAGEKGEWIASGMTSSDFNETNYAVADFAGFAWISEANYVGTREVAKRPCLLFHDKVVTMDQREFEDTRAGVQQAITDWETRQKEKARSETRLTKQGSAGGEPAATPGPLPSADAPPRPFNIDDYKMDTDAVIDAETGMPVTLTYKTQSGAVTRTFVFQPNPPPLSLPPEVQQLVNQNAQRLQRMSSRGAVP